jgi:hypothetical protein
MLAGATRFVWTRSRHTIIVARRARAAAAALGIPSASACDVDWGAETAFAAALSWVTVTPPQLALIWVHDTGYGSLLWLLRQLMLGSVLVVHVLGSSHGDPRAEDHEIKSIVSRAPRMRYVTVVLGSKALTSGGRRWLTDDEISAGAIEAIETGRDVVVGEIVSF